MLTGLSSIDIGRRVYMIAEPNRDRVFGEIVQISEGCVQIRLDQPAMPDIAFVWCDNHDLHWVSDMTAPSRPTPRQ